MKKIVLFLVAFTAFFSCKKESPVEESNGQQTDTMAVKKENSAVATLFFSGYSWYVKNSMHSERGPGPNYWNRKNAWVDSNGSLHLAISKVRGKWFCAEVQSVQSFGYGRYQWQVEGPIDRLDKNIVLGLFDYSGNDGFDEMDIEFARWGNSSYPNLNYTVWPAKSGYDRFAYSQEFSLNGTFTTHRLIRDSSVVTFESLHGFAGTDNYLFATATCTDPPQAISRLAMPVHMNLWLFQGNPPSDGKPLEIIIHHFTYQPL